MTCENLSAARKTCPGTALYTTNKTQTDLGLKPGIRGQRPLQLSKVDLTRYWITHAYVQLECQQVRLDVSYQRHNYTNLPHTTHVGFRRLVYISTLNRFLNDCDLEIFKLQLTPTPSDTGGL